MAIDDGNELVAKGEITEPSLFPRLDAVKVMENRRGTNFCVTLNTHLRVTREIRLAPMYCRWK